MSTDRYVNSNVLANNKDAALVGGADTIVMSQAVAKTALDNDTSVLRMFKAVDSSLAPIHGILKTTAISGATDVDMGVYKTNGGAVISKDCLLNGQTLASASKILDALADVAVADFGKPLYLLAGQTAAAHDDAMDIALTGNTFGTNTGTISVTLIFGVR